MGPDVIRHLFAAQPIRFGFDEHAGRNGDPTRGGSARTPIMTAYRQEALRCALLIEAPGSATLKSLRDTGLVPNALG